MYDKVTPNFPMAQVLGRPKTKSLCKDLLLASKYDESGLPVLISRVLMPEIVSSKCYRTASSNIHMENFKSPRGKEKTLRRNQIKLQKNEMKLRRNLPIAPWRTSISSWETSLWAHLSTYSIQNLTNRRKETVQALNDRCWTFALLWYAVYYRLFGIAVLTITIYLCTV